MQTLADCIIIKGVTVNFRVFKPERQPKRHVLMLSAPGVPLRFWYKMAKDLVKKDAECVVCEMPGFGSDTFCPAVPATADECALFIWGLLDELDAGTPHKWELMAQGMACSVIAVMAMKQPDYTGSLFFISPILNTGLSSFLTFLNKVRLGEPLVRLWLTKRPGTEKGITAFLTKLYGKKPAALTLTEMQTLHRHICDNIPTFTAFLCNIGAGDYAELGELFLPCMVIWSGKDALLGGNIPKALKQLLPHAEFHVLPEAGHTPQLTDGDKLNDFLRGWTEEYWN